MNVNYYENQIRSILEENNFMSPTITVQENMYSFSLYFFDTVAMRFENNSTNLLIKSSAEDLIPSWVNKTTPKSMKDFIRIPIDLSFNFSDYSEAIVFLYEKYIPSKDFGCCNSFILCSDAKKCLKTDRSFSERCMYKENLDNGKIYYGKNKNI